MNNSDWNLIDADEDETTAQLVGCKDNIKLSKGKYLAVWDMDGEHWQCFFSTTVATELLQGQYLLLDNSDSNHPFAMIYFFKLFNE